MNGLNVVVLSMPLYVDALAWPGASLSSDLAADSAGVAPFGLRCHLTALGLLLEVVVCFWCKVHFDRGLPLLAAVICIDSRVVWDTIFVLLGCSPSLFISFAHL